MPYLCPQTLTTDEQTLILRATAAHHRDHLIFSMALGTGLRLSELIGLNVGVLGGETVGGAVAPVVVHPDLSGCDEGSVVGGSVSACVLVLRPHAVHMSVGVYTAILGERDDALR